MSTVVRSPTGWPDVPRQVERLDEHLGHHDRRAEVDVDAAVEPRRRRRRGAGSRAGSPRRSPRRRHRVHVDDVGADRDVHRRGNAGARRGGEDARPPMRQARRSDRVADGAPEAHARARRPRGSRGSGTRRSRAPCRRGRGRGRGRRPPRSGRPRRARSRARGRRRSCATAARRPRSIRSTMSGPRPTLIGCAPMPRTTGLPAPDRARDARGRDAQVARRRGCRAGRRGSADAAPARTGRPSAAAATLLGRRPSGTVRTRLRSSGGPARPGPALHAGTACAVAPYGGLPAA